MATVPYLKLTSMSLFFQDSSRLSSELCMIAEDFEATSSQEISVRKGQTVEIVERIEAHPEWCIVRALAQPDGGAVEEGLIPVQILDLGEFL